MKIILLLLSLNAVPVFCMNFNQQQNDLPNTVRVELTNGAIIPENVITEMNAKCFAFCNAALQNGADKNTRKAIINFVEFCNGTGEGIDHKYLGIINQYFTNECYNNPIIKHIVSNRLFLEEGTYMFNISGVKRKRHVSCRIAPLVTKRFESQNITNL